MLSLGRKYLFGLTSIFLVSCSSNPHKDIDRTDENIGKLEAGTIIHQRSRELGNGFFEVSRSQVNSPDHWEGIGHFSFIFYQNKELCQCSEYQVVISPEGKYAIYYSNQRSKLELFNVRSEETIMLSDKFIGYPQSGEWDFEEKTAIVKLQNSPNGNTNREIEISLD